jgi:peptidoglycan/xylan/chitin deacetylase (PgdA/CDA1 family)
VNVNAYSPPRDFVSKVKRRLTQGKRARPAHLRFERPILSVCFDDFPHNAATLGASLLESHDGRGTFYACASLANVEGPCGPGFTAGDLAKLKADEHEIACHSFSHHDLAQLDTYDALIDLARNSDALRTMGYAGPLQALAYPYGETASPLKAALPARYLCARGVLPGLNVGAVDLAQLRAYALFGAGLKRARAALRAGAARKAWMIVFTHDISETPSAWGTTPDALDAFLADAVARGYEIAPVSTALAKALP